MGKFKNLNWRLALLAVIAVFLSYCNKSDTKDDPLDPSNLVIEILSIDHENYEVVLQASAQNTIQYQLFVGPSSVAEEVNETGYFKYVFQFPGNYNISVRAYGESGRYVKSDQMIAISPESDPVPLSKGYISPMEYTGYTLVWQDEFDGSSVNTADWSFELGNGCPNNCGWGNNELQYYRSENAWVGDSVLTIEARKESFANQSYTSARMVTKDKKSFQYGRIDIRALLPEGKGLWPALWMLGNNFNSVGWPGCGEIDIMEMIGGNNQEKTVYGTVHWSSGGEHASYGQSYTSSNESFTEAYHVFSIIWDEEFIRWYVDDQQYNEISIANPDMSEFHQEFFFIFNVAVGGNWPGNPDNTTIFPQQMKVDYIRMFQQD